MNKLQFCERLVYLDGKPISFAGRPYLREIYSSRARNLVIRASRQVEKSTFLVNTILYEACTKPGLSALLVTPRREQAEAFCESRLLPAIDGSPIVRRLLAGTGKRRWRSSHLRFANGSELFIRAAFHSADACRGLSCSLLLVDEFQDIAAGDLPVMQQVLSHAPQRRTIMTGTPKTIDNHLEGAFRQSTASEWTLTCPQCAQPVILDERALGPQGIACPRCAAALDAAQGRWVPRNPGAKWGEGFWISHLMVPWLNYDEILENQQTYDPVRFRNEVIGLPTTLGDHALTRAELEACCRPTPMAQSPAEVPAYHRQRLIAGIDWSGGMHSRTVMVIGAMRDDYHFEVYRLERFLAREDPDYILAEVARRCEQFQVRFIAADGAGNGHVYNRMLVERLGGRPQRLFAMLYSVGGQPPRLDGSLWKWVVDRSDTIGTLVARVKKQKISFPRAADVSGFLDEFACQIAEYDDHLRAIRYTHPETQPDDALHATNYALIVAAHAHYSR